MVSAPVEKLTCHPLGVVGAGPPDAEVMLVGIAPGRNEMVTGRPFTGQSGILTNNILEAVGYPRDKCFCTNVICYQIEEPTLEQIMACRPRFLEEIAQVKPKLIVALGAIVTSMFFSDRKFGEVRGMIDWHPQYNCYVMSTYHPAAILRSGEMGPTIAADIVNDFAKIKMFFDDGPTGRAAIQNVQYEVVTTTERAQQIITELPTDRPVMLDVETDNKELDELDPQDDQLLCLAISYVNTGEVDGSTWVIPEQYARGLNWRENEVQWGAHYFAFDSQVMLRIGADLPIKHDSLLAHFALDERSGKHKLKPLTREYCYAGFYEADLADARKGRKGASMGSVDSALTHEYNAKDAAYEARILSVRFIPRMKEEGVYEVYTDLLIPAANVYKYMQWRGVPVSRPALRSLAEEWIPLLQEKDKSLHEKVEALGGPPDINFDSFKQLSKFLFSTLRLPGGPSTAKGVLDLLKDEHPFVGDLLDLRHLTHLINTYLIGINNDIKRTGRVHPTPLLHGTVSGRCSYSRPAINTIPRPYEDADASKYGFKLRRIFAAEDDDHIILEWDYRQAEIWMAAFYCNDPQLWIDLQSGDIHTNTAAFIHNISHDQVRKAQRSDAKRTTFGKFFGIGVDKLARQIKKPSRETAAFMRRWDERYPMYVQYTRDVFKEAQDNGHIRAVTGQLRRFPIMLDESQRNQIINWKIQHTAHACLMASITEAYHPAYALGCEICIDGHDAIIAHARKDNHRQVARLVKDIMEKPRWGLPSIPVEVKAGPNWGEAVEIDV